MPDASSSPDRIGARLHVLCLVKRALHRQPDVGHLLSDPGRGLGDMVGFLLQWPTLPTLVMFPILLAVDRRRAIREEREIAAAFGAEWDAYSTPPGHIGSCPVSPHEQRSSY